MPIDRLLAWLDPATAFGAATVVLAVSFSLPQLLRLRRTGATGGVSLPAIANSTISFAAWTGYALALGDAWLLASSAVGVPGGLASVWLAWRRGADRRGLWLPALWVGVLVAATAVDVLLGPEVLAAVIGASVLWLVLPALVTAWRSRDVTGIAAGSWWILAAEGVLFLGYGLTAAVTAPVVYGVVCLAGSFGVLLRLAARPPAQVPGRSPQRALAAR